MLKRKITDFLLNWKKTKQKECLLIKGARQVGKTFIVDDFGKKNYKSYVYINFIMNPEYKEIFEGDLSANEIYKKMSFIISGIEFVEKETLIFLDEIQECPNSRTALKFLAIDDKYDFIASGSLLGINYKEISSIPVGYERQIQLYSLDFEEFLWSQGINENIINELKKYYDDKKNVPEVINKKMFQLLREYLVVGGMPEVVSDFTKNKDFNRVHQIQEKISNSYLDDISKYAYLDQKPKIRSCYLSIPKQLAKENKKFQFSVVEKNGRSRKYEDSLNWLRDANLINIIYNVKVPNIPLVAYEINDNYKIYLNDTGILNYMYGFEIKKLILSNEITGDVKGGIYENLVCDFLVKKGYKINYFKIKNSSQEIEFLIEKNKGVIPIEVKAGNNASVSLSKYIEEYKPNESYKFITGNVGFKDKNYVLPLYMVMFL